MKTILLNPLDALRQAGRTTRMLEHAKKLAKEGRAVYVMADKFVSAELFREMLGSPDMGIKFETPDTLPNFDWSKMRLRGSHPNCVVLVDHFVIERRYAAVLEMLHAYDAGK